MTHKYFATPRELAAWVTANPGTNVVSITYDTQSSQYVLFYN